MAGILALDAAVQVSTWSITKAKDSISSVLGHLGAFISTVLLEACVVLPCLVLLLAGRLPYPPQYRKSIVGWLPGFESRIASWPFWVGTSTTSSHFYAVSRTSSLPNWSTNSYSKAKPRRAHYMYTTIAIA